MHPGISGNSAIRKCLAIAYSLDARGLIKIMNSLVARRIIANMANSIEMRPHHSAKDKSRSRGVTNLAINPIVTLRNTPIPTNMATNPQNHAGQLSLVLLKNVRSNAIQVTKLNAIAMINAKIACPAVTFLGFAVAGDETTVGD